MRLTVLAVCASEPFLGLASISSRSIWSLSLDSERLPSVPVVLIAMESGFTGADSSRLMDLFLGAGGLDAFATLTELFAVVREVLDLFKSAVVGAGGMLPWAFEPFLNCWGSALLDFLAVICVSESERGRFLTC